MYLDLPNFLNLSIVDGVGATRLRSLIAKFKSAEDVFRASADELHQVDGLDDKTANNIKAFNRFEYGNQVLEKADSLGIKIITFWDEQYPYYLKKIFDPPALLYVRGDIDESDKNSIAIVGTREPSIYGQVATERIAQGLINKDITIVSGLARGVDTIAHRTAVKAGNRTLAVLGTGLDYIYPIRNKELVEKIVQNGAVISEYPFGIKAVAKNFPRRNRIIAGLSLGTVVIEAGKISGALITANLALDYNREVFAVPGPITSEKSYGCNQLIKAGAKLITSAQDVLEEFSFKHFNLSKDRELSEVTINLTPQERQLLTHLSSDPVHIDELTRKINISTYEISTKLLALEFKNLVKQLPGKYFILAN